jgi:phage gpG-like protein
MTQNFKVKPPTNLDKIFAKFEAKAASKAVKSSVIAAHDQFIQEVGEGFDQQKTPGGEAWHKLAPWYAKYKQEVRPGKGILQFDGKLKKAALKSKLDWSGNSTDSTHMIVSMPVNDPKAVKHQFGEGKLPARPFFRVLGQAKKDVLKAAFEAFDKKIRGS